MPAFRRVSRSWMTSRMCSLRKRLMFGAVGHTAWERDRGREVSLFSRLVVLAGVDLIQDAQQT